MSILDSLTNWHECAATAKYSPAKFTKVIGSSGRNVRRHVAGTLRMTLGEYLRALRCLHMERLLKERKTLQYIADEVGFKSVSHLCREFKGFFGISPALYQCQWIAEERLARIGYSLAVPGYPPTLPLKTNSGEYHQ